MFVKISDLFNMRNLNIRVSRGWDEVQQCVHPVIPESRITLDTRLFRQDVVVLALEISNYLLEPIRDVKMTCKAKRKLQRLTHARCRCCPQSQGCRRWSRRCAYHPPPILGILSIEFQIKCAFALTNSHWPDPDALLEMCSFRTVDDLVAQYLRFAQGIYKSRASSSGSAFRLFRTELKYFARK